MSTGTILGIGAVVVLAIIILAGGIFLVTNRGGDDSAGGTTTTTAPDSSTTEGDGTTTTEDDGTTTTEDDGTTTTESTTTTTDESGEVTVDGGTATVRGRLDGVNSAFHDIDVPSGVTATIVVTPTGPDLDIVLSDGTDTLDDGFRGEPEFFNVTGPIAGTFEISSFFGDPGSYTITIE